MKKKLHSILAIILFTLGFSANSQTRYLDDVFSAVTVTSDVTYATNISILPMLMGLAPAPAPILCDIYEPTGDSIVNRPVIILAHTGSFLPPVLNGQPTGSKTDSSIVEQCTRWAKKGYVAVAMDNRLGWNPTSTDQNVRTSSLLQAAYRGIQDAKAMVRYMRMTEATGNTYGIDPTKIVLGGQGTGGYIALGYPTLDNPATELMLPKFINFNTSPPSPYVYPPFFGNPDGTDSTYLPAAASPTGQTELWNIPNNPSYSNEISMAFNIGGCLADSSWLEAGDVPMVSFHCAKDENGPYANGDVIVPTTGNFVVEAQGSYIVQKHQDMYANNAPFANAGFTDPITVQSVINNTTYSTINNYTVGNNYEGLYTFVTPGPSTTPNPFGQAYTEEGAPWDWWDNTTYDAQFAAVNGAPAGYGAANSILGNPDMSALKGNLYIDTIQGYLNPRIFEVLGFNISSVTGCMDPTACNYDPTATVDDGSCLLPDGCTDMTACNYNAAAVCDDGSCLLNYGCMNPAATNYDPVATCPDTCIFTAAQFGCTDSTAYNFNPLVLFDDGSCCFIAGCTDSLAFNYDATACYNDGSCIAVVLGCTDVLACNYNIYANIDDGSCDLPNGCGDPLYVEYDASVTCSDPNACITLIATGINEVIDASTEIYPNPANTSLNVVSNSIGINTISICNLHGQEVLNTEVNANQIRLNTSNLAKGVYIIDIKSNDASVKRKLIIE